MSHLRKDKHPDRPTHTVEDYLLFMFEMVRDDDEIVAARLAELLNVTPATVAMTLKRMERDQWIINKGRGDIRLTDTGLMAAKSVTRRHMLVECMLVDLLKMPINETHREAHAIEHAISPALEERLYQVLDHPKLCPHGNPFPGYESLTMDWTRLTEIDAGETVIIRRIHTFAEENPDLIKFLVENGVNPGTSAELVEKLPFNQTLSLQIDEEIVTLGFQAANLIFAEIFD